MATVRGRVLRSWRVWSLPAAGGWSLLVVVAGLLWAADIVRSPLGRNDPRAGEVGSVFDPLEPTQVGVAVVAFGLAGILTVLLAWWLPDRRWLAVPALCLGGTALLVVPDVRVIQNFAYLFFGYTGKWEAGLAVMLVSMAGGLCWCVVALARMTPGHGSRVPRQEPSWAVPVTVASALLALPYPIVRIAWALEIPLGVPASYVEGAGLMERVGESGLGGLAVGGAILTIGLIRPWGEVFPRWLPFLGRRRVPIWVAVVPALWAAVIITQAGLRILVPSIVDAGEVTSSNWGEGAPGFFFVPWGVTLVVAVYGYVLRRQRRSGMSASADHA